MFWQEVKYVSGFKTFRTSPPTKKLVCYFFTFLFLYTKKIEKNYFCFIFLTSYFSASFLFSIYFRFLFFPWCFHICSCFILSTHTIRYTFCTSCFFCSFCQSIQTARFSFRFTLSRCATSSSSLHINSSIWTVWLHTQRVLKTQSKHIQWNENINLYTYYHTIILACE